MSAVAGIMLVRDEADIIERSLDHAASQVDYLIVADNRSRDGTREIVYSHPGVDLPLTDPEIGHYHSKKMTYFARVARRKGFAWVVPMDADELWSGPVAEGYPSGHRRTMTVAEWLRAQPPPVKIVTAALYDYLPPSEPQDGLHPFEAIRWRRIAPGTFPKVAARTHVSLVIEEGNHGAHYRTADGIAQSDGLMVRHFTWRSEEQFLRKIRNGLEAYAATDLDPMFGAHWRMWEGCSDEEIVAGYRGWTRDYENPPLEEVVYDPVT